jgi:hypothetical protein
VTDPVSAADRVIAVFGAQAYVRGQWPAAERVWGGPEQVPVPDDLDGVWREHTGDGERWFAVTATAGEYGPAERAYDWGQRVVAGTRDYLRFAIARLREHGRDEVAGGLEREMYAGRLVYLRLDTVIEDGQATEVNARQYDISDAAVVTALLEAVRDRDSGEVERLRQPLGPGAARALAEAYWTLGGWHEKALLVRVLGDARQAGDPRLAAAFADVLAIPDVVPGAERLTDTAREARTVALTRLAGDTDPEHFVALYEDEAAQAEAIARYRAAQRG